MDREAWPDTVYGVAESDNWSDRASTSRQGLTHQVGLECNPEIPVSPGEEHYVLDKSLDEVYFALQ